MRSGKEGLARGEINEDTEQGGCPANSTGANVGELSKTVGHIAAGRLCGEESAGGEEAARLRSESTVPLAGGGILDRPVLRTYRRVRIQFFVEK